MCLNLRKCSSNTQKIKHNYFPVLDNDGTYEGKKLKNAPKEPDGF